MNEKDKWEYTATPQGTPLKKLPKTRFFFSVMKKLLVICGKMPRISL